MVKPFQSSYRLHITVGYLCQFLPCRNFCIATKLDGKNCINTVLGVVASTTLDTKDKTFFVLKF